MTMKPRWGRVGAVLRHLYAWVGLEWGGGSVEGITYAAVAGVDWVGVGRGQC